LTSFVAAVVSVEELPECETFMVGFSEQTDGDGHNLQLQITLEDDPSQGYLNYYCLVGDEQATFYGGITSCKLTPDQLQLSLAPEACAELNVQDGYIIDFKLGPDEFFQLKVGLQRILDRGPSKLLVN